MRLQKLRIFVNKIVIRVDGNSQIGLGHIYRGIALAEMLKDEFDVCFVTKPDSTITPITDLGFSYKFLPEIAYLDEPEWLKQNIDQNAIIICDGYEFKSKYQKKIKQEGFKLVYVDDLVEYHMYADLIINHSPGIKKEDYKVESYTQFALGLDYAILRPAFLEAAKQKREITKIDTAFVCFGGSDVYDLTLKATKALLGAISIKKINIVVGSAYEHKELFNLSKLNNQINIYKNLSEKDLLEVMKESDIAIVPSSTILFELCSVKCIIISGYYADNQKIIYKEFLKREVFIGAGNFDKLNTSFINDVITEINISDRINVQEELFNSGIRSRMIYIFKNIQSDKK